MVVHIGVASDSPVAMFAATELAKYLRLISAQPFACEVKHVAGKASDGIVLKEAGLADPIKPSADDDSVALDITGLSGTIIGANPRSILLGVYRFLHHLGCRWVRPGLEGEYLPRQDLSKASVRVTESASYRHRVICIEGAVSVEHVLEVIDWAPKAGFSGYFMQFHDGWVFYDRWYSHVAVPGRPAEPFSADAARAFTIAAEEEIRHRGLAYHAIGHGWTCRALGVELSHWSPFYAQELEQNRDMLALVKGKRDYAWDRPMITSLCFSRADVRGKMVQAITDYAVAHPEVDLLHVWIDDGGNNKCECDECSKSVPADPYVQMLIELDASLTTKGSPMRIVFISYSDLLWPPSAKAPKLNTDRFVFLYANSRGDYSRNLETELAKDTPIPPYVRNKMGAMEPGQFRAFREGWWNHFQGDAILFEYYLGSSRDVLTQYQVARVIHRDVQLLKDLKFNGMIDCQAQRVFFPTGLPMYVMGQTLWNDRLDFDAIAADYFHAAFGPDSAICKETIKLIGERLNAILHFGPQLTLTSDAPRMLVRLETMLADFAKLVGKNRSVPNPCQARSWYYMDWFLRFMQELTSVIRTVIDCPADTLARWQAMRRFVEQSEADLHHVLDVWAFVQFFDAYLVNQKASFAPQEVVRQ